MTRSKIFRLALQHHLQTKAEREAEQKARKPIVYTTSLQNLVTQICAAVLADEQHPDGCDISGGMFGTQFSQLVQHLARDQEDAERFRALTRAAGDWRSGGSDVVKLFDDDATGTYHIKVGNRESFYARSYEAAADQVAKAYPPELPEPDEPKVAAPAAPEEDDDEI